MRHFLIKKVDGSVGVMITTSDDVDPNTEIAKWHPDDQAKVTGWEVLELEAVPTDRYFRNAWTHVATARNAGHIAVDMDKAREIHRDVLRRQRAPLLASADVDYVKADEAEDVAKKAEIRAYKQALRDVPADPRIDAAQTPEELKAIVPDALL